jgi:hypothetical protein
MWFRKDEAETVVADDWIVHQLDHRTLVVVK